MKPGCWIISGICLKHNSFSSFKDEWFTDDLKKINDEKCYEKIMGHWIIEMPDDRTGNRRFIPLVASGQPEKHPLENEIETRTFVNNAWAEAMKLYQSGKYKTILSGGLNEYIKTLQRDLMPEDTKVGIR